jgi:hypothetical protein
VKTNPEVDAWFARYDNPQKATVLAVREVLLGADTRLSECIKWQCPTFTYEGNLASVNPKAKQFASLLFHTGAHIPGKFPNLKGGGGTARYMQFATLAEVRERKTELVSIVRAWCDSKASGNSGAPRKKAGKPSGTQQLSKPTTKKVEKASGAKKVSKASGSKQLSKPTTKKGAPALATEQVSKAKKGKRAAR